MKTIDGVRVPEMGDFATTPLDLENMVNDLLDAMDAKIQGAVQPKSAAGNKSWAAPAGIAAGSGVKVGNVVFPAGRFITIPVVVAGFQASPAGTGIWSVRATGISTTGCELWAWNLGSVASIAAAAANVGWIARDYT